MNQSLKHYKALLKRVESNPFIRELDREFLDIFQQVYEKGHNFQQLLLSRLQHCQTSVFKYLKDLRDFTCYMDPQMANQEILPAISNIQRLLDQLCQLRQALIKAFFDRSLSKSIDRIIQFFRFKKRPQMSRNEAYLSQLAAMMDRQADEVMEILQFHGFNLQKLYNIPIKMDQMIRQIFAKELSLLNKSAQSPTQVFEDLEWLEKQISSVQPIDGQITEQEISNIIEQWNRVNSKNAVRAQKVQKLANRLIGCLMLDEMADGTKFEVCQHLRKNNDFRRAVCLCSLAIILWLTKRIRSWSMMCGLVAAQNDREKCIKVSSFLALSLRADMPRSLKLFMFHHQYEMNIIGRNLTEVVSILDKYHDCQNAITRAISERFIDFLKLRLYDLANSLAPSMQLYGFCWRALKKIEQIFDLTFDQFAICCIYAGTLLKTGKTANFNNLLKAYYNMPVKQQGIGWINSHTTIIDYYNKHIVNFIQNNQQHLRPYLDRTQEVETPRVQFLEALKISI